MGGPISNASVSEESQGENKMSRKVMKESIQAGTRSLKLRSEKTKIFCQAVAGHPSSAFVTTSDHMLETNPLKK